VKTITIVICCALGAACTPREIRAWHAWHDSDPRAAEDYANQPDIQTELAAPPGTLPPVVDVVANARGRCAEWYDEAMAAGFSDAQWPTVDRVMFGESRCQPGAYNPSGARGLMQILGSWADDCGGSPGDLFSPGFNLRCARHVLAVQGWQAWSAF
jgi:hypothetical protein